MFEWKNLVFVTGVSILSNFINVFTIKLVLTIDVGKNFHYIFTHVRAIDCVIFNLYLFLSKELLITFIAFWFYYTVSQSLDT